MEPGTPAQIALAWLSVRKPFVVPIPGTTNVAHMEENVRATAVTFTPGELKELDMALASILVLGARLPPPVLAATGVEAPPKR